MAFYSSPTMALGEQILVEFVEAAWIGREHHISAMLYVNTRNRLAKPRRRLTLKREYLLCPVCRRIACRCAKKGGKHRRDYALHPRQRR